MGSYLVVAHKEGYRPLRASLNVERLQEIGLELTFFRDREIPAGFIQVPSGPFIYQGDRSTHHSGPRQDLMLGDFFISEFPVTCAEYTEFLRVLGPEEARKRLPREAEGAGHYWRADDEGGFSVSGALKIPQASSQWRDDWPILGISWEDLVTYIAWKGRRMGYLLSLPHEALWEKSARGADGRSYPWGNHLDPTFSNMNLSFEQGATPAPVDSFPADESPYGVRGLGGNARDWCLNDPFEYYPGWRVVRGGYWTDPGVAMSASRAGYSPFDVYYDNGGRIALYPTSRMEINTEPRSMPHASDNNDSGDK
jgi:serine/threonine-protein kinase